MLLKKNYKCQKCGKTLNDYKPIRLNEYRYNTGKGYKQYLSYGEHYDLCHRCYKIFKNWVTNKNKEVKNE